MTAASAASTSVVRDAPMFEQDAFRLTDEQAEIMARARRVGETLFADRAAEFDRTATFPTANYKDLHREGLLGICIPKSLGGLGAGYQTYSLAAAEIGRYCGATALTWNMHVCSTLWSGPLADDLEMDAAMRATHNARREIHYRRILEDGAIYAQPFSEGGAAAAGTVAFGTARRSSPRSPATPTITGCSAPRPRRARRRAGATPSISRFRRPRRGSPWSATGIRSACAAPSRARSCSRTCSCPRTRR
jgi:hypothetical protein